MEVCCGAQDKNLTIPKSREGFALGTKNAFERRERRERLRLQAKEARERRISRCMVAVPIVLWVSLMLIATAAVASAYAIGNSPASSQAAVTLGCFWLILMFLILGCIAQRSQHTELCREVFRSRVDAASLAVLAAIVSICVIAGLLVSDLSWRVAKGKEVLNTPPLVVDIPYCYNPKITLPMGYVWRIPRGNISTTWQVFVGRTEIDRHGLLFTHPVPNYVGAVLINPGCPVVMRDAAQLAPVMVWVVGASGLDSSWRDNLQLLNGKSDLYFRTAFPSEIWPAPSLLREYTSGRQEMWFVNNTFFILPNLTSVNSDGRPPAVDASIKVYKRGLQLTFVVAGSLLFMTSGAFCVSERAAQNIGTVWMVTGVIALNPLTMGIVGTVCYLKPSAGFCLMSATSATVMMVAGWAITGVLGPLLLLCASKVLGSRIRDNAS